MEINESRSNTTLLRRLFAGLTAATILFGTLAVVLAGGGNILEVGVFFILSIPILLAPSAIYYFKVTTPRSAVVCGVALVVLTVPTWILVFTVGSPWEFYAGVAFLLTLISSTIGAFIGRRAPKA